MQYIKNEETLINYDTASFPKYKKQAQSKKVNSLNKSLVRLVDEETNQEPMSSDKLGAFFV